MSRSFLNGITATTVTATTVTATTVNATSIQMGGVTATSAATNNALVIRNGSGGFSAGAVTASSVVTSSITGGTTATAFATTKNLTLGVNTNDSTHINGTNNILSGGTIETSSTANNTFTDNYSVKALSAIDTSEIYHTINIGTGTVTNDGTWAAKTINIGTGSISGFNAQTAINIGAGGGGISLYGAVMSFSGGSVVLPSLTYIGNVSPTELGYLDGVTSAIQTQLDSKERLVAKRTTATAAIASTETVVLSFTAAANTIVAGDVFRFTGYATATGSTAASPILRIRIGTTTLTGATTASVTTLAATSSVTNFRFEAIVTCRTAGASGTVGGAGNTLYGGGTYSGSVTAPVTVNTTVQNLVEVTFISGLASRTYVFDHAILEKLPA